jgi:hypothetical protein
MDSVHAAVAAQWHSPTSLSAALLLMILITLLLPPGVTYIRLESVLVRVLC